MAPPLLALLAGLLLTHICGQMHRLVNQRQDFAEAIIPSQSRMPMEILLP